MSVDPNQNVTEAPVPAENTAKPGKRKPSLWQSFFNGLGKFADLIITGWKDPFRFENMMWAINPEYWKKHYGPKPDKRLAEDWEKSNIPAMRPDGTYTYKNRTIETREELDKILSGVEELKKVDPRLATPGTQTPEPLDTTDQAALGDVYQRFLAFLKPKEGRRNVVYLDSLGKPTVGYGHLVRPEDNLKVGDRVSNAQIEKWLQKDGQNAFKAAQKQMQEIQTTNPDFVPTSDFLIKLSSVNYQLGTAWTEEFHNTWDHIKHGRYDTAIANLETSLWNSQTANRVDDFQGALRSQKKADAGGMAMSDLKSPAKDHNSEVAANNAAKEFVRVSSAKSGDKELTSAPEAAPSDVKPT